MHKSCATLTTLLLLGFLSNAQETREKTVAKSVDEIAKDLANPNSPMATLTFKNQFRWYEGDLPHADSQSNYTRIFQPSLPFSLPSGALVFFRPAIPAHIERPVFDASEGDFDSENGLGGHRLRPRLRPHHKEGPHLGSRHSVYPAHCHVQRLGRRPVYPRPGAAAGHDGQELRAGCFPQSSVGRGRLGRFVRKPDQLSILRHLSSERRVERRQFPNHFL